MATRSKRMARPLWLWLISSVFSFLIASPVFSQTDPALLQTGAEVNLWGVHILTLRADYNDVTPAQRAAIVERQIQSIPLRGEYRIERVTGTEGRYSGAWIRVNDARVFGYLAGDVPDGMTLESYGDDIIANLQEWLARRHAQQRPQVVLYGLLFSVLATLVFAGGIALLWRGRRHLLRKLDALSATTVGHKQVKLAGIDLMPFLIMLLSGLMRLMLLALAGLLAYLWITFVLRQFPYTRGVGEQLTAHILVVVVNVGSGILSAIPDLIMVVVIFWLANILVAVLKAIFLRIEQGRLRSYVFDAETAKATRRVIVLLVWIFAAIIAYPYIPGSDTEAFKGVSVFLGLMVSLGSAGIVSQVLGGLIVVYSRAFQPGDFVKIAEHEGTVSVVGVLSTKIKTLRNEEVSVPNAVLLGASTLNYSKLSRGDGLIINTAVTIGYDTPWRQVHELLLSAASRCERVRKEPKPFVIQTALNDWYVEYRLLVSIDVPAHKLLALSELHQLIQDEFAAAHVQIMSPHFVDQPDKTVLPPPWPQLAPGGTSR